MFHVMQRKCTQINCKLLTTIVKSIQYHTKTRGKKYVLFRSAQVYRLFSLCTGVKKYPLF